MKSRLILLLFCIAPFAGAQESCTHGIIRAEDSTGKVLADFRPDDFQATIQKNAVKITSAKQDTRQHHLVVLVGASGSMRPQWERNLALASDAIEDQSADTKVAVLLFNFQIVEEIGFEKGQTAIMRRLHQLRDQGNLVRGSTALYDTINAALRLMGAPTSADSVYVISDGEDNSSRITLAEMPRRLRPSDVKVFVSLLPENGISAKWIAKAQKNMAELTKETGGELISPFEKRVSLDQEALKQFEERMRPFHRKMDAGSILEVESAKPLIKGAHLDVRLTNEGLDRLKGARLVFPEELGPCRQ